MTYEKGSWHWQSHNTNSYDFSWLSWQDKSGHLGSALYRFYVILHTRNIRAVLGDWSWVILCIFVSVWYWHLSLLNNMYMYIYIYDYIDIYIYIYLQYMKYTYVHIYIYTHLRMWFFEDKRRLLDVSPILLWGIPHWFMDFDVWPVQLAPPLSRS